MNGLDFTQILLLMVVLVASLSVPVAAHAWAANLLGDPTARRLGRLTLNPVAHVDVIGTLIFPLVAISTNLPLIGWAKPVPVDFRNLRHPRRDFALVAAAGPASNVLMAVAGAIVLELVGGLDAARGGGLAAGVLLQFVLLNVLLAVFNMVPVPPLDGGNVVAGLLRGPVADMYERLRPYGFIILYGLMFTGVLTTIISPPVAFILYWLR